MVNDRKHDRVSSAIAQLKVIIDRFIRASLHSDLYDKAFECLEALRAACVKEDEAP